jgi:hypothetical protein
MPFFRFRLFASYQTIFQEPKSNNSLVGGRQPTIYRLKSDEMPSRLAEYFNPVRAVDLTGRPGAAWETSNYLIELGGSKLYESSNTIGWEKGQQGVDLYVGFQSLAM